MRPSPLLTAVGASAGTFVVLGGATAIVSGVALSVAKRVVRARRVRRLPAPQPCLAACQAPPAGAPPGG